MNGLVSVYKEKGYTSHDVVACMRGIFKQKKIGHTGTLDPMAEGVLPVCLGAATKLCSMIEASDKTYEAQMLLGRRTDTQDITGNITACLDSFDTEGLYKRLLECMDVFTGEQKQIPPMYSAKKQNGKKLYELARAGIVVDREPVSIVIHKLEILSIDIPYVSLRIKCSKGTYIRTLIDDIGEYLGVHACMSALLRTRVGEFCLADSLKLSDMERLRDGDGLEKCVKKIEDLFPSMKIIDLSGEAERLSVNGNKFRLPGDLASQKGLVHDEKIFIRNHKGVLTGIFCYNNASGLLSPVCMLKIPRS